MNIWAGLLGLVLAGSAAGADWTVNSSASGLSFVSTKNVDIAESHVFETLTGSLNEQGAFVLNIDLKSLDTRIPIRNDRIHEHLFGGSQSAQVSGQIDPAQLGDIGVGDSKMLELNAELSLLEQKTPLLARVLVSARSNGLQVTSVEPVLLNMRVLGLGNGIEKLREIAGLTSISMAVPVYINLTLQRQ